MKSALVIGTTGQLARALAETPIEGFAQTALGRDRLDLAEPHGIREAVRAHAPDIVINAAAYTAVDQAENDLEAARRINGEAPGALAAAAAEAGAPFIHVSTDYVYPGDKAGAYREDDPTDPINAYGASKLVGETAARAANPRSLVLRTAWVYAPWGRNFLRSMLRLGTERDRLTIVDDQHGCPTSALSLARAIAAIAPGLTTTPADDPAWGVYHYAGKGQTSWAGFAEEIFAGAVARGILPGAPEIAPIPTSAYPTPARRPANSVLDCSKFETTFGIETEDWRDALAETLERISQGDQP